MNNRWRKIAVKCALALGLSQPSQAVQIIAFDAPEVIFSLGVDRAEYRIGVGLAVNVGDTVIVADDLHLGGMRPPSGIFRGGSRLGDGAQERQSNDRSISSPAPRAAEIHPAALTALISWLTAACASPYSMRV